MGNAIEQAMERDRTYFDAHPSRPRYVRRRIPGEFGPREGMSAVQQATHVLVTQLQPGIRSRQPILVIRRSDYPTGRVPLEHIEAAAKWVGTSDEGIFPFFDDEFDDRPI